MFYFIFSNLNIYLRFTCYLVIYSVFHSNLLLIWGFNLSLFNSEITNITYYCFYFNGKIIIIIFVFNSMLMEWWCTCVEVFINSVVEGSDCTSYIKKLRHFKQIIRWIVQVFWLIFGFLIGQLARVHVVTVLISFFVRYWRREGPEWVSCISSPSL